MHKACSGISDDFFKALEDQVKNSGMAYWACRPCTAYSQGITRKMRAVEAKVEELSDNVTEVKDNVKEVKDSLEKVENKVKQVEEKVNLAAEKSNSVVFEELREREARRLNLVLQGVPEHDQESATGKERRDWDLDHCMQICKAMDLEYDLDTFKFCRRVGVMDSGPRPMVIGLYTEMERSMMLRRAKRLENTTYKDVRIAPDLTKRQRQEERSMWKEVEDRNTNRTEDQLQKNLAWMVVGARGERRIVLQPNRQDTGPNSSRGWSGPRSRPPSWTGPRATARGGRPPQPRGRGGQGPTRGVGTSRGHSRTMERVREQETNSSMELDPEQEQVHSEEETAVELESTQEPQGAQAASLKRKATAAGLEGRPPEKR